MAHTVLVTDREFAKAASVFEAAEARYGLVCQSSPADEASLAGGVCEGKAAAVVVGVERYEGALYDALPAGGVLARFGVGHDSIDKTLATERKLLVTNTPGVLDNAVAEHTLWLIGALARGIPAMHATVLAEGWTPQMGQELRGKTLAVLGCGKIGGRVAEMASVGFGMKVVAFDCLPPAELHHISETTVDTFTQDLPEAVADADWVSVHLPAIEATRHLCDASFFATMKAGARFVNTSRGSLVDERALFEALASGQVAGAALDVFENEPYRPTDPAMDLRTLDNVVLTPHAASTTVEACRGMAEAALANVQAGLEKRFDDMALVNPEVLERLGA